MRIKRENLSNFAFVLVVLLILFTPIGFHARVFVSRIFSFSPAVLDADEQQFLSNYNWALTELGEESFDFKNFEGKVVIVNFWATWCPPCVAEMPSLQELYNDYGEEVAFVLIAHDEPEKVKKFLIEKEYSFPVYFERNSIPVELTTENIPTTFIIDGKGRIVVKKTGAANWNSKTTRELLENLVKE